MELLDIWLSHLFSLSGLFSVFVPPRVCPPHPLPPPPHPLPPRPCPPPPNPLPPPSCPPPHLPCPSPPPCAPPLPGFAETEQEPRRIPRFGVAR